MQRDYTSEIPFDSRNRITDMLEVYHFALIFRKLGVCRRSFQKLFHLDVSQHISVIIKATRYTQFRILEAKGYPVAGWGLLASFAEFYMHAQIDATVRLDIV